MKSGSIAKDEPKQVSKDQILTVSENSSLPYVGWAWVFVCFFVVIF